MVAKDDGDGWKGCKRWRRNGKARQGKVLDPGSCRLETGDWRLETETETETGQADWSDMERETDTRRWAGLRRAGEPNEPLPG